MKRYSHAAYPNQHKLEENPTGEWVQYSDVRHLEEANKALMDERAVMIRTHREQLDRLVYERDALRRDNYYLSLRAE